MTKMHKEEFDIDVSLVKRLIKDQFSEWSSLQFRQVSSIGTDNVLYRLGEDKVVRLPRINWAVDSIEKESEWLPKLAPFLPFSIPNLLGKGSSSKIFPYPWSIYEWMEGSNPIVEHIQDPEVLTEDLVKFIQALQKVDLVNGPISSRGVPLDKKDTETQNAIHQLKGMIDVPEVTRIWEMALKSPKWVKAPVWVHGDLSPGNLIIQKGRLSSIIDFGMMGVGDPACDLVIAWNLLPTCLRNNFRGSLGVDEATWARGRGWALSNALIALPYYKDTNPELANNARYVIQEVLEDYRTTSTYHFIPAVSSLNTSIHECLGQTKIFDSTLVNECLNTKYGIISSKLVCLPLGADMNVCVYKAEAEDGKSYFLKLRHGFHSDVSLRLLAWLDKSKIRQIIPPIQANDRTLTQHLEDFTLTVYPFVVGENGFCRDLTADQWFDLGRILKQIHALEVPPSIKNQIRKETYSSIWRDVVQSFISLVDGDIKGDEIALSLQAFMKKNKTIVQRLVKRAEFLSEMIQTPEFVICHSDIHGGNVLIDKSNSFYIVDWDEPIMAPKERDLMFIGGGVGNVWNNPSDVDFFYKGYGKTSVNNAILAYYRHERIVQDIGEYCQILLLTSDGGENRYEMYKQFLGMFEPNGVVDIAFKTDEISL